MNSTRFTWALGLAAAMACGGEEAPPPGAPAAVPPPAQPAAAEAASQAQPAATDTAAASQGTGLLREVFSYRGSGRDPFRSLLTTGAVRPLLEDLRVMAIVYDAAYPARSVAILRDTTTKKRYDVRVDDELGRLRVVAIRPNEVVFSIEEFGVERQVTLALRRRQEGVP
ncbi:MAG: hypothetical protein KatS3mg081_1996 [Gemmatimonadales bacterium]|nr:MAG: hypothetical protein KatS3mg081_1996 [Gemmatimonadales bacterium]